MKQKQFVYNILFFSVLFLAAFFRFTGINWDDDAHLHPDERFLTMVATDISWPKNIIEYFDTKTSPLNPHNVGHSFYVYGTYPVYLTKFIAGLLNRDTYGGITIVGRVLSGVVDMMTLGVVMLIGGPVSGLLYAMMVLPIQQSHFFTVDPYATFFLTVSLYFLIKKRVGILLGIAVGLAISAKISSILILPIIVIALLRHPTRIILVGLITMLVTVRLFYPYLFDGWGLNQLVLDNWKVLKAFDGVNTSFPPGLQWIGVPFWKPTYDMVVHGLGIPLGLLVILSLFYRPNIILLSWILLVLGYQSFQFAKAMRYLYPIYPMFAILTATFMKQFKLMWILPFLFIWPIAYMSIYTKPHTRIAASDWIYTNIPSGSTIAWEHWDDPLPLARGENHIGQYRTLQLPMYDLDMPEKWQKLAEQISKTDSIILSSNRIYGGVAHAKNRYPITNRYYQLLFSGKLGFEKVAEFTSRPTLFGFEFNDDTAEESFTVYDHPKVAILKNNMRLTANELYRLIILP